MLPQQEGYQHLSQVRAAETAEAWQATFVQEGSALRLWMLGAAGTTVVTGEGLGQDLTVPVPFALARREGTAARFITILEPYRGQPGVRRVHLKAENLLVIESADGTDEIGLARGRYTFQRTP